ncbi:hypothetical protein [Lysobacter silvisoli]|uniref:hypothetical protein n=1 Tax=Lysobacter silvisoli TaxID=2293254 RepID=UPI0011C040F4|nr:hypothetical protein [Lysobacter silvisoli]
MSLNADSSEAASGPSKLARVAAAIAATLSGLAFLLALAFGAATIFASATIPEGEVNEAGFGFVFTLICVLAGAVLLVIAKRLRRGVNRPAESTGV